MKIQVITTFWLLTFCLYSSHAWAIHNKSTTLQPIGFANNKMFYHDIEKGTVVIKQGGNKTPLESIPIPLNLGEQLLACQKFKSQETQLIALLLDKGMLHIQKDDRLSSVSLKAEHLISGLCGNIDADILPEIIILAEKNREVFLYIFRQGSHQDSNNIIRLKLDAPVGNYQLHADFSKSSAHSIGVLDASNKIVERIYPHQLLPRFEYQKVDHSTIWQHYTNMNRASAKLMWNAGARSLAKLDLYVDSVTEPISFHEKRAPEQVKKILKNLSVNQHQQAVDELTQVYINWKRGKNYNAD
ncbi:hypothetical protein J8M20_04515 [Pseudoalteromonas luteoviolacea]|uniref:hypothetical protein n=1 Tax=Pseudoalteromonas luteoviolacea TaxID=43657 RepID=UPI001B3959CE|nr:hypothetical protein [Pseudoalteromonas luteoviolacea]MBQ4810583.1 hypothetical protein [Pseudoalteromonas luteoviolacea]